ncbi:MAG: [protein-PII] uridylyltransferase [Puniceicoccales bacterium]|nr:[protein-PII] uridylyltransferase [Puniceicoccales bacterium]
MLLRRHKQGMEGLDLVRWRAAVVDVFLEHLLRFALRGADTVENAAVALVAHGGYGRGELCPFSDIDLMFLYDGEALSEKRLVALQERVSGFVLGVLWDTGFKPGHASRTVKECAAAAGTDAVTCNTLLDTRLVAGNERLFAKLMRVLDGVIGSNGAASEQMRYLFAERAKRHARHGGGVFTQEPDVKNGVGGLRDFQTLCWIARLAGGEKNRGLEWLVEKNVLTGSEAAKAEEAYSFLLRVRNELHFQAERADDVLDLEKQPAVAVALACEGKDWERQIEALMRRYFKAAEAVHWAERAVKWHFFDKKDSADCPETETDIGGGFVLRGNLLSVANETVFAAKPMNLLRVFRFAQEHEAKPDFPLLRLARANAVSLTPSAARKREAITCFLAILADAGRVGEAISLMDETGVLCRFLPEFSGIHRLVQREIFHRHTVDVHTLLCLRELDKVFADATPETACYHTELLEIGDPLPLYLALLLHDIGKQLGISGHAQTGAAIAAKILRRLKISHETAEEILFLIRSHLDMSAFWQRHDLDDPANFATFAAQIGGARHLRLLYVLTYCDARATAPELWNEYKNSLHRQLFYGVLACFERIEGRDTTMLKREDIEKKLSEEISAEEISVHFDTVPVRYFQQYTTEDACLHIRMVNQKLRMITSAFGDSALAPVIHWTEHKGHSDPSVTVVTWDREGLFYKLAGAFAVSGLDILSVKAFARSDHIAIDTFRVNNPHNAATAQERFANAVEAALVQQCDHEPDIRRRARALRILLTPTKFLPKPPRPKVKLNHDNTLHRTIIDIRAADATGLLFFLARTFFRHRLNIVFARINTERGIAQDTFHLEPFSGEATKTPRELDALRETLLAELDALAPAPP